MLNQSKEMVLETIREMYAVREKSGRQLLPVVDLVKKLACKPNDVRPVLKELAAEHWIVIVKNVGDYNRIRLNSEKIKRAAEHRAERYHTARALHSLLEEQNRSDADIYVDSCWNSEDHPNAVNVSLTVTAYDDRVLDLVQQIGRLTAIATRPREHGPLLPNQRHCIRCGRITGNGQPHDVCEP